MRKVDPLIEGIADEIHEARPWLSRRKVVNEAYAALALRRLRDKGPHTERLAERRPITVLTELGRFIIEAPLVMQWEMTVQYVDERLACHGVSQVAQEVRYFRQVIAEGLEDRAAVIEDLIAQRATQPEA